MLTFKVSPILLSLIRWSLEMLSHALSSKLFLSDLVNVSVQNPVFPFFLRWTLKGAEMRLHFPVNFTGIHISGLAFGFE